MTTNKNMIDEKEKKLKTAKEDVDKFEGTNKGTKLQNMIKRQEKAIEAANKKINKLRERIENKFNTKVKTKEDKLKAL